ncbi:hypothetical protein PIB30_070660 [Stylosanthes scabra]|uniref:Aminotransferase-like plant mobile domain-containing protein n=1 Tax=Stylosanthes scabra TaxID=79078 RepID=A0ABU6SQ83_9FABA|nr:hypothetical protein [Stylosanthes scabra]
MVEIVDTLRSGRPLNVEGPMWLAQLWLNTVFEKYMEVDGTPRVGAIEGVRLSGLRPSFTVHNTQSGNFWSVFRKFLQAKQMESEEFDFMPFAERHHKTNWFRTIRFDVKHENEQTQCLSDERWAEFTCAQMFPVGFPQYKKEKFSFEARLHVPHLMAQQMGFAQAIPALIALNKEAQIHRLDIQSAEEITSLVYENDSRKEQYKPIKELRKILSMPRRHVRNLRTPPQTKATLSGSRESTRGLASAPSEVSSSARPSKENFSEDIKIHSEKSKASQEASSSPSSATNPKVQKAEGNQEHDHDDDKVEDPKPDSSSHSFASLHSDSDLNVDDLIFELKKATSPTIIENKGHFDSVNKTITPVLVNKVLEQTIPNKEFPEEDVAPLKAIQGLVKNLRNSTENIEKCEARIVELDKDMKLLLKSETNFKGARSKLDAEAQSAAEKLAELTLHKTQLKAELAGIEQEIANAKAQEQAL